jgi:DNA helicase-2/ATP-dependent DNA helicase PcrA
VRALFSLSYAEISAFCLFLDEHTPFSTKHGVKGTEYDHVFVILDDKGARWNIYSFDKYLSGEDEAGNAERYARTRNLFYVCCSRPRLNLAVIDLGASSRGKSMRVSNLFGTNVFSL